jgi:hypothetical protein
MRTKSALCLFAGFARTTSTNLWIVIGQQVLFQPSATALTVSVTRTPRRSTGLLARPPSPPGDTESPGIHRTHRKMRSTGSPEPLVTADWTPPGVHRAPRSSRTLRCSPDTPVSMDASAPTELMCLT